MPSTRKIVGAMARGCMAAPILLSLTACGPACVPDDRKVSVEYVPLEPPPRPISPRPAKSVRVVASAPPYPFVETALLEARQDNSYCSDQGDIIAKMRAVAGQMGCDLVIIHGGNDVTVHHRYGDDTLRGYRATCAVYYAASATARSEPAARRLSGDPERH